MVIHLRESNAVSRAHFSSSVAAPAIITRLDKTFSEDLTFEDRARLRAIVRKRMPYLFAADDSNRHLDQVIDALGPVAMRKTLMRAIAKGDVA